MTKFSQETGCFLTPHRALENAACGDAQRRTRGLQSPHAEMANAAGGVCKPSCKKHNTLKDR